MKLDWKTVENETFGIIDGALAILNKYPDLSQTDIHLSLNKSVPTPLPFLMDLFKSTAGYNKLIEIISQLLTITLPIMEAGVKTIILTKLKDIISCSVNPFFTEEILRDGIVFNVSEIDIANMLINSPLDKKVGKYFYFDVDETEITKSGVNEYGDEWKYSEMVSPIPDDLLKCNDMNALIWYMINKSSKRHVWKPKKYRKGPEFREDYPHTENTKLKKEDGIVTFEYHSYSQSLKDAYGQPYKLQTPYQHCFHVFIGDAREKEEGDIASLEDKGSQERNQDEIISKSNEKIEQKRILIRKYQRDRDELLQQLDKNLVEKDACEKEIKKLDRKIANLINDINSEEQQKNYAYNEKQNVQYLIQDIVDEIKPKTEIYFPFINSGKVRNYYYGKTLIQFNIDYITSVQFFEAKSLTARLLDCLTGLLTIDLNLSYEQQLIKDEVKKMVSMIVETDDAVVSDCFFTFSNKDYDAMSRKAELRKAGLLTINGDETSAVKVDAEQILSKLNQINANTNQEKIQSIIQGSITEISKELSNVEYAHTDKVNYGVEVNFIENILESLAEVFTMTVLSPKVYLLLLINLKIIGRETNFNLEGFIDQYKQLLVDIVRSIRDHILEYLTSELMKIVGDIVKQLTIKLSLEQVLYWQRLYKSILDCWKYRKQKNNYGIDFNIDDVDYADIYEEESEPQNNEC